MHTGDRRKTVSRADGRPVRRAGGTSPLPVFSDKTVTAYLLFCQDGVRTGCYNDENAFEGGNGMSVILETKGLKKYYGSGPNLVKALDGVDLAVEEGEFAAVVGASGSGKSTLLHMLGGLDYATEGTVKVAGKDIFRLNENELTVFRRRRIGFVFQNYNLVPVLNVYENIVLPLELDGRKPDGAFIRDIAETLGISDKTENLPGQLSGGQQQRVAIARALAAKPAILLADEPTGNLDSRTTQEVLGLLKLTSGRFHQTVVMITHNEALAQLCGRVIHMEDGKILDDRRNGGGFHEKQ